MPTYPPSTWTPEEIAAENIGAAGLATPTITGISPSSGTAAGGTTVVITGTNFPRRGVKVQIGTSGAYLTPVRGTSSTKISFVTPATSAGATTVRVLSSGTASNTAAYTFT